MTTENHEPGAATAPGMPRKVWITATLILIGAVAIGAVFAGRFGQNPRLTDSPLIGKPLPPLVLEHLEEDGELVFADLQGRAVVINFWASWCFPCRLEHDDLISAAADYADKGVHFVGISYQDRRDPAIGFLDEFGRGTNYSYVMDDDSRAIVELGVFGVPETYFVDADGIIRARIQGEVDTPSLRAAIEETLAAPTP